MEELITIINDYHIIRMPDGLFQISHPDTGILAEVETEQEAFKSVLSWITSDKKPISIAKKIWFLERLPDVFKALVCKHSIFAANLVKLGYDVVFSYFAIISKKQVCLNYNLVWGDIDQEDFHREEAGIMIELKDFVFDLPEAEPAGWQA